MAGHKRKHIACRADNRGCVSGYTYISKVKSPQNVCRGSLMMFASHNDMCIALELICMQQVMCQMHLYNVALRDAGEQSPAHTVKKDCSNVLTLSQAVAK